MTTLSVSVLLGLGIMTSLAVFQQSGNIPSFRHLPKRRVMVSRSAGQAFLSMPAVMSSAPGVPVVRIRHIAAFMSSGLSGALSGSGPWNSRSYCAGSVGTNVSSNSSAVSLQSEVREPIGLSH